MKKPTLAITSQLYFWVLLAIFFGGFLGHFFPDFGISLRPVGDAFISLVKMLVGPIIFCTVVLGIAGAGDLKKVGRVGVKAIVYFEVVSTAALALGLIVVNLVKPGSSFNANPKGSLGLDSHQVESFAQKAHDQSLLGFVQHIIPTTLFDPFTGAGDLLQVLLVAILFGFSLSRIGTKGKPVFDFIESLSKVLFQIMHSIMKLAPFGAGAAIAFTIGKYGADSIKPLLALMLCFYATCLLFVFGVLGMIGRWVGFSIVKFLSYIREELLVVLGTSSSESALAGLMEKLEKLGAPKSVVGLVVPAGYSFNLDGTNIYLTMAALFIAQAMNIDLSLTQQMTILGVAIFTSKGASGVTGAGFITLAATLTVVPEIPIEGMALILGVDRFMSEGRAITNIIGNGVAALAVSRWEKELDLAQLNRELGSLP